MNKKHLIGGLGLALVAAALVWWRTGPDAPSAHLPTASAASSPPSWWQASNGAAEAGAPPPPGAASNSVSAQEVTRLQKAYEQLTPQERATVEQTRAYEGFMGRMSNLLESRTPRRLSVAQAQQLMGEIDHFQREDYYSLNHALQMKMAIARMAHQGADLEARLAELRQQFEREHAALVARSDPRKDPTLIAFKAEEGAMIERARRMSAFPDGLTRDQFIIRESEKIRLRHYPD